jgi:16S rRNA G966 N2-methylase RsmD
MIDEESRGRAATYDRQLLLDGARRNVVLELWEVQRYGSDSYADADHVSVYGMCPADWYAAGVRLLGRTAVECTRDVLGSAIGKDIAAIAARAPRTSGVLVIDPFAGSGNTLYWILRQMPDARGLGFEIDTTVFELTKRNLAALALPVEILNADYLSGLARMPLATDHLVVAFIAPPWGNALSRTSGLDLRRTTPPVAEIVDAMFDRFRGYPLVCAIQVYETVDPESLLELKRRFDWSTIDLYRLNPAGQNHGVLLGTKGWTP